MEEHSHIDTPTIRCFRMTAEREEGITKLKWKVFGTGSKFCRQLLHQEEVPRCVFRGQIGFHEDNHYIHIHKEDSYLIASSSVYC